MDTEYRNRDVGTICPSESDLDGRQAHVRGGVLKDSRGRPSIRYFREKGYHSISREEAMILCPNRLWLAAFILQQHMAT